MKSTLPLAALSLVVTAVAASCAKPCNDDTDCTKGVETCVAASDDASGLCVNNNDIDPKSEGEGDVGEGEGEGDVGEGEGEGDVGEGEGEGEDGVIVVVLSGTDQRVGRGVTERTVIDVRVERNGDVDPSCVVEIARAPVGANFTVPNGAADFTLTSECAPERTIEVATLELLGIGDADDGVVAAGAQQAAIGGAHLATCTGTDDTTVDDSTASIPTGSTSLSVSCGTEDDFIGDALHEELPLTVLITSWSTLAGGVSAGRVEADGTISAAPQSMTVDLSAPADCSIDAGAPAPRVVGSNAIVVATGAVTSRPVTITCTIPVGAVNPTGSATTTAELTVKPELFALVDVAGAANDTAADFFYAAAGITACTPLSSDDLTARPPDVLALTEADAAQPTKLLVQVVSERLTNATNPRVVTTACGASIAAFDVAFKTGSGPTQFPSPGEEVFVGDVKVSQLSGDAANNDLRFLTGLLEITGTLTQDVAVSFNKLERTEGLQIGGSAVQNQNSGTNFSVRLPKLRSVLGALAVESNGGLERLDLSLLQTVSGTLDINSNDSLASLDLSSLKTVSGRFVVQNNTQLDLIVLGIVDVSGGAVGDDVVIDGNNQACVEVAPSVNLTSVEEAFCALDRAATAERFLLRDLAGVVCVATCP